MTQVLRSAKLDTARPRYDGAVNPPTTVPTGVIKNAAQMATFLRILLIFFSEAFLLR